MVPENVTRLSSRFSRGTFRPLWSIVNVWHEYSVLLDAASHHRDGFYSLCQSANPLLQSLCAYWWESWQNEGVALHISCLTPSGKAMFWPASSDTYMVSSAEGGWWKVEGGWDDTWVMLFHFCTKVFIKVPSLDFLLNMNTLSTVPWMKGPNLSPSLIRAQRSPLTQPSQIQGSARSSAAACN